MKQFIYYVNKIDYMVAKDIADLHSIFSKLWPNEEIKLVEIVGDLLEDGTIEFRDRKLVLIEKPLTTTKPPATLPPWGSSPPWASRPQWIPSWPHPDDTQKPIFWMKTVGDTKTGDELTNPGHSFRCDVNR